MLPVSTPTPGQAFSVPLGLYASQRTKGGFGHFISTRWPFYAYTMIDIHHQTLLAPSDYPVALEKLRTRNVSAKGESSPFSHLTVVDGRCLVTLISV